MRKVLFAWLALLIAAPAVAQSFAADVHFTSSAWSEFDGQDPGVGGRVTWRPIPLVGIDADFTWYPSDYPSESLAAFSGNRFEGMFGATIGPKLGFVRPFVKGGAGFLSVGEAPRPFACIAIYPPPLNCLMAAGETLPAYEIGGGVELDATAGLFLRADVSDRILKYPGPSLRSRGSNRQISDDGFFGGAFRFSIGAGIRF